MDLDLLLDALADRVADRLLARLAAGDHHADGNGGAPSVGDVLLTADEAAARLGVKPRWLYGHAATLPFVVRLPGRGVRFSEAGLTRWVRTRTRAR